MSFAPELLVTCDCRMEGLYLFTPYPNIFKNPFYSTDIFYVPINSVIQNTDGDALGYDVCVEPEYKQCKLIYKN